MEVNDAGRLQDLEDGDRRLKEVVAELALDNQAPRAVAFRAANPECDRRGETLGRARPS